MTATLSKRLNVILFKYFKDEDKVLVAWSYV